MQTGGLSRSLQRYQRILNQTIKHLYTMEEMNEAICGDVFTDDAKTAVLMAARQKAKEALKKIS